MLTKYEETLVSGWEDLYKKAQLSLWILLSLKDSPKQMAQIKTFIDKTIHAPIQTDDRSMYRSLRRLIKVEIISFQEQPSSKGPQTKVYALTDIGHHVLAAFLERIILPTFYNEHVETLIKKE